MRKQQPAADALHVAVDDPRRSRLFPRGALFGLALLCVAALVAVYPGKSLLPLLARTRNDRLAIDYLRQLSAQRAGDPGLRRMLAQRYAHIGKSREALATLAGLRGRPVDELRLRIWQTLWNDAAAAHDATAMTHAASEIRRLVDELQPADFAQWKAAVELSRRFGARARPRWLAPSLLRLLPLDPADARQARDILLGTGDYELAARVLLSSAAHARDTAVRDRLILAAAQVLLASGDPVLAWRRISRAIGHAEVGPAVRWMMVRLSLGADQPAQAVMWLHRCIDLQQPAAVLAQAMDARQRELAWRVLLGAGLPAQALRVADAQLVAHPADRDWQQRRARVLEWSGQDDAALRQWMQVLRAGYSTLALEQEHRLALGQHSSAGIDLYWRERAAHTRMGEQDWLQYAQSLESAGHARAAVRVLRGAARAQPGVLASLAWLLGNLGEVQESLRAYAQAAAHGALDLRASIDYADALVQSGRFAEALEVLRSTQSLPGPATLRSAHQRLLGDLAWDLGRGAQAEAAYASVWARASTRADLGAYQVERLITLTQRGRGAKAALAMARQAWRRQPSASLALLWLQLLQREPSLRGLQDWQRSVDGSPLRAELSRRAAMYAARAQVWQALGRQQQALADQTRALQLAPGDRDYEIGLLWICIDGGDRACLRRSFPAYADALRDSPGGLEVSLAAAQALGDTRVALAYAQRLYPRHKSDALWMMQYGELWQQAGDERRAHAALERAWELLQVPAARARQTDARSGRDLDRLIARLRLGQSRLGARAQQRLLAALRSRLLRGPLTAAQRSRADAAIADWLLRLDTTSAARWWLAHETLSTAQRQSVQLQLDLRDADPVAVARDLRGGVAATLAPADLAQALQAAGKPQASLRLAQAVLERAAQSGQDSPALRALQRQTARREIALASRASLAWQDAQVGDVTRRGPLAKLHWQLDRSWSLDIDASRQALGSSNASTITGLPATWSDARVGLQWHRGRRSLGFALRRNEAVGALTGWRVDASARLAWAIQGSVEVERNAVADESAALQVAGARDRVRLQLQRDFGRAWASVTASDMRYHARDGQALGSGRALQEQLGLWLRRGEPDVALKLLGYQQQFTTLGGVRLPTYAALVPGGAVPDAGYFLPAGDSAFGAGIAFGMDHARTYADRWMPYGEIDVLQSRTLGLTSNIDVGVRGPLFGVDQLVFGYQRLRDTSGQSRLWFLQYRWWFGR